MPSMKAFVFASRLTALALSFSSNTSPIAQAFQIQRPVHVNNGLASHRHRHRHQQRVLHESSRLQYSTHVDPPYFYHPTTDTADPDDTGASGMMDWSAWERALANAQRTKDHQQQQQHQQQDGGDSSASAVVLTATTVHSQAEQSQSHLQPQQRSQTQPSQQQRSQDPSRQQSQPIIPNLYTASTPTEFEQLVLQETEPVAIAVKFYAPRCRACQRIAPEFERFARDNPQIKFVQVPYIHENKQFIFGLGVTNLPFGRVYSRASTTGHNDGGGLVYESKIHKAALFREFRRQVLRFA